MFDDKVRVMAALRLHVSAVLRTLFKGGENMREIGKAIRVFVVIIAFLLVVLDNSFRQDCFGRIE